MHISRFLRRTVRLNEIAILSSVWHSARVVLNDFFVEIRRNQSSASRKQIDSSSGSEIHLEFRCLL